MDVAKHSIVAARPLQRRIIEPHMPIVERLRNSALQCIVCFMFGTLKDW